MKEVFQSGKNGIPAGEGVFPEIHIEHHLGVPSGMMIPLEHGKFVKIGNKAGAGYRGGH